MAVVCLNPTKHFTAIGRLRSINPQQLISSSFHLNGSIPAATVTRAIGFFNVGWRPVRFERRPTIRKRRELMVGRRGEAPLVPPYILPSFKKALALTVVVRSFKF